MNHSDVTSFAEKRTEIQIQEIMELVEIESPSFDENGIGEAVEYVESMFSPLKAVKSIKREYRSGFGEHLFIRTVGSGAPVLVLGHLDTVHPKGSTKRNPTRLENGRLYGCGSFDMKANVVVVAEALRTAERLNLKTRPLNILLSCDEEVGSDSGRPLVEEEAARADFCLVLEPSLDGKVKTGRKGVGGYKLSAKGIPAHAGLDPEKGVSAILELSRQIPILHEMSDLETGVTVSVGTIKGGTTTNVIPEYAECTLDVRFESIKDGERVDAGIKELKAFDERVELSVEGEINRPPLERDELVIELFARAQNIAKGFGFELEETQVGGASDGNYVSAMGIPVLDGLGIKGNGAHTLQEYVEVNDIPKRISLLVGLISSD